MELRSRVVVTFSLRVPTSNTLTILLKEASRKLLCCDSPNGASGYVLSFQRPCKILAVREVGPREIALRAVCGIAFADLA
eukprot:3616724-Pleurochrysis_carterae.AAC.1